MKDELYLSYLEKLYQYTHTNQVYSALQPRFLDKTYICLTYGELLYPSVKKLIQRTQLSAKDVFLDLGSGLGKCILQVFMQSDVKAVIGIEADEKLHQQAYQAISQMRIDVPYFWEEQRTMEVICGNFLDVSWEGVTAIYSCSTCFTKELLIAIGNKANQYPAIKQVLSLRPLPTLALPLKAVFGVECSWDSALCFHYAQK